MTAHTARYDKDVDIPALVRILRRGYPTDAIRVLDILCDRTAVPSLTDRQIEKVNRSLA